MPDRAMELRHLAQADRQISQAERRVLVMEEAIARGVKLHMNVDRARASLALIVEGLNVLRTYRLLILKVIEDIDRHPDR